MTAATASTVPTLDLEPAARRLAALLPAIRAEQLADPTPCPDFTVATLLDHLMGLTTAFTDAAHKTPAGGGAPVPSAAHLDPDWRTELPDRLAALVTAWREPAAWEGETEAGGVVLPAQVHGIVALNEIVVHGWDLARATRQRFSVDAASAAACLEFCSSFAQGEAVDGLFGPAVPVGEGAPVFHRVLGYAGRDPRWSPNG
ncbi:TIGR03086 family metal-binding protein [Pseudonocardia halophobica]|uniref:TIGR03086 family metal-binding protein n=1 Tax=Pseudonocardia halophobica TaxID=29401 RepID=UPI003D8D43D8